MRGTKARAPFRQLARRLLPRVHFRQRVLRNHHYHQALRTTPGRRGIPANSTSFFYGASLTHFYGVALDDFYGVGPRNSTEFKRAVYEYLGPTSTGITLRFLRRSRGRILRAHLRSCRADFYGVFYEVPKSVAENSTEFSTDLSSELSTELSIYPKNMSAKTCRVLSRKAGSVELDI